MKNQELFTTYVAPHLWEGWLWCDDGWGPKNQILDNVARATVDGHIVPVYIHPDNTIRSGRVRLGAEDAECTVASNERYKVAFPGKFWKEVLLTIKKLRQVGVKQQRWTLTSWVETKPGEPEQAIYRMFIVAGPKSGDEEIRIIQGSWIPTFQNSRAVAGWRP